MDSQRVWRSVLWKTRRDMGSVMQGVSVLVAVGAAFVAIGLVWQDQTHWVWIGLAVMILGLALVVAAFVVGVSDRYREEGYRCELTTFASNGRQFLTDMIASKGRIIPTDEISAWEHGVRVLLNDMDPTGIYVQRFDTSAGLATHDYRMIVTPGDLGPGTPGGNAARQLSFRLVRLSEIMRESER